MIDLHNHVLPGVDDGAADADEAVAALEALAGQGVTALVATPHVDGSLTADPAALEARLREIDRGWERLEAAAGEAPERHRGAEVMLDTPEPDLSDPRLRLAGGRFVLVEFPYMAVPPHAGSALFSLKMAGWVPLLAHPERYANAAADLSDAAEWRRVGAHLQVNAGSLAGRYGERPRRLAWALLAAGAASYVGSDYHARGAPHLAACRRALEERGGGEQARLLLEVNPRRLLQGEPPLPVPALGATRAPLWRRLFRSRGG